MSIAPEPGLVIRYDYLWKREHDQGQEHGRKDRPCAIILASKPKEDGHREVVVSAISHAPPTGDQTAVEIPYKVARHLGLDDDRGWIFTHEVNVFDWPEDQIPYGVTPAHQGEWSFGALPNALGQQAFSQVRENSHERNLDIVRRVDDLDHDDDHENGDWDR